MDTVHLVVEYVEEFPPEADVVELRSELSAFTHGDLRAACRRLKLSVRSRQKKKSGFIAVLVSYWKTRKNLASKDVKTPLKAAKTPVKTGIERPHDVAQFVQFFPPHGRIEKLQSQLDACRSRTLRSACVLLGLQPKKTFGKPEYLGLLVTYWQDSLVLTPTASLVDEAPNDQEVAVVRPKRPKSEERDVMETPPPSKKKKTWKDDGDLVEEKAGTGATLVDKAKSIKEWASAIEILSRVEGSAECIESIREVICEVVDSARSEL